MSIIEDVEKKVLGVVESKIETLPQAKVVAGVLLKALSVIEQVVQFVAAHPELLAEVVKVAGEV